MLFYFRNVLSEFAGQLFVAIFFIRQFQQEFNLFFEIFIFDETIVFYDRSLSFCILRLSCFGFCSWEKISENSIDECLKASFLGFLLLFLDLENRDSTSCNIGGVVGVVDDVVDSSYHG